MSILCFVCLFLDFCCALLAKTSSSPARNSSSNPSKKKDRPLCTYCNMQGHVVNRCYKLHGYPPGHRLYKANSNNDSSSLVASVPASSQTFSSLNVEQCLGLLTMLQNHLSSMKVNLASTSTNASSSSQLQV